MPDITGVGVDLIEIERIRHSIDSYGDAFLNKLFTKNEIVGFEKYKDPAPHIAGRFAAKEAVAKSLGTGIGKDLAWHDITITSDPLGKPLAHVKNTTSTFHLSISHSKTHATAFVIAVS